MRQSAVVQPSRGGEAAPAISGRQIVCLGFAEWDAEIWTNQQHLMFRLASRNRILFVESLGLRRPQVSRADARRMVRRLRRGVRAARRTPSGVYVLSPLVLPWHSNATVTELNSRLLTTSVVRATDMIGIDRPILWAYVPQAEMLVEALRPTMTIYHCVDDIAMQPGVDFESFRAAEERFASRADLVLASAPALFDRMRRLARDVRYVPNVADTELFSTAIDPGPLDPGVARLPRPLAVFIGAIVATKLDIDLLVRLARLRRDWTFALVGPIGPGDPSTDVGGLTREENVHFVGARRQEALPAVLRGADVGLVPYKINDLTRSVFPMKVFEYLAAGLPVISTPLPALGEVADVSVASGAEGFAELMDHLRTADSSQSRVARSRMAMNHSWESRMQEIGAALRGLEARRGPASA